MPAPTVPAPESHRRPTAARVLWSLTGLLCVGVGGVGVVVPGLPTTVFFIAAAACFTRSSPRLERWVLGLPGVGRAVRDHRSGLGMPRRAKQAAIASVLVFSTLAVVVITEPWVRLAVVTAAAVGTATIWFRVPTSEQVLEARGSADGPA